MEFQKNPHLKELSEDVLYHLGLSTAKHDLVEMFGDIKFVCLGGRPDRMKNFAHFIMDELGYKLETGTTLVDICKHSHRYSMYKVGCVLSVSHGMGVPSVSILLHELFKLLWYAGADDAIFFRIGTSGGVGIDGGTVVVTKQPVDGLLRPLHENIVLGNVVQKTCYLDSKVADDLIEIGRTMPFPVEFGNTMCTNDFYEGQGRLDGAFCDFTESDKLSYLERLRASGVRNIEMEATVFAALTSEAGFRAAVVCVTLLNRLEGDQLRTSKETMHEWESRPQKLVACFIKKALQLNEVEPDVPQPKSVPSLTAMGGYEDARIRLDSLCN